MWANPAFTPNHWDTLPTFSPVETVHLLAMGPGVTCFDTTVDEMRFGEEGHAKMTREGCDLSVGLWRKREWIPYDEHQK